MKIIDLLLSCTLLLFVLTGCSKKEDSQLCITYKVVGCSNKSYQTFISYRDSTGLVSLYTTDQNWSKKVCLPSGVPASLITFSCVDWELHNQHLERDTPLEEEAITVSAQIIHENKTVAENNKRTIILCLTALEVD